MGFCNPLALLAEFEASYDRGHCTFAGLEARFLGTG